MRVNKIKLFILVTILISSTLLNGCVYTTPRIEDLPVLIDLRDIGYENSVVTYLESGTTTYKTLYYDISVGEDATKTMNFIIYQNDNVEKLDKYYEYLMIDFEKFMDKMNSACQEGCIQLGNPYKEKYENIKKYKKDVSTEWDVSEAYADLNSQEFIQRIFLRDKNKIILITYYFEDSIEITEDMRRYIVSLMDVDLEKIEQGERLK